MTDFGGLAVVAAVLYLWECAAWVPHGAEAFVVPLRGRWRLARESWSLARPPGRVVLGPLMPGEGGIAVCEARHPRIAPDGVCVCDRAGDGVRVAPLAWHAMDPVRAEGRSLRAGGPVLLHVATPRYAARLATVLEEVRAGAEGERAGRIEAEFDRLLDVDAVRDQASRYRREARNLRPLSWALAALVVVALPVLITTGSVWSVTGTAFAALLLAGATVIVYGWRRLALGGRRGDGGTLAMTLMPLAALRADDYLARDAFAEYHVWAVARGAGALPPWTRAEPSDADAGATTVDGDGPTACCEAAAWADRAWTAAIARREAQQPERPLREALRRESPDAVAYCPRCHQQYARTGACADCVDVTLLPLEPERVARS